MAITTLPPWLNISPQDFVAAAERGAQLGTEVARMRTQAALERERLGAQASEAGASLAQRAAEAGQRFTLEQAAQKAQQEEAKARLAQATASEQFGQGLDLSKLSLAQNAQKQQADRAAAIEADRKTQLAIQQGRLKTEQDRLDFWQKVKNDELQKTQQPVYTLTLPGANKYISGGTVRGRLDQIPESVIPPALKTGRLSLTSPGGSSLTLGPTPGGSAQSTAADKLTYANQLKAQHPEYTKAQLIQAANDYFSGGPMTAPAELPLSMPEDTSEEAY